MNVAKSFIIAPASRRFTLANTALTFSRHMDRRYGVVVATVHCR